MARPNEANAKRRAVVARAAVLFDERGYNAVSVSDTAAAVGLSKAALYHYFSSKDQILFEIHDAFIGDLIASAEARAGTMDPVDELRATARDLLALLRTHRPHVRVFLEHHRELSARDQEAMEAKRTRYRLLIEDIIRRGVDAGELREVVPEDVVRALYGMNAWTIQWYDPATSPQPQEIADYYVDLLLDGLAEPEAGAAAPT